MKLLPILCNWCRILAGKYDPEKVRVLFQDEVCAIVEIHRDGSFWLLNAWHGQPSVYEEPYMIARVNTMFESACRHIEVKPPFRLLGFELRHYAREIELDLDAPRFAHPYEEELGKLGPAERTLAECAMRRDKCEAALQDALYILRMEITMRGIDSGHEV